MIPDRDYYADKHGRLTDDPIQYAQQIAVKGCFLDPRVAARYGIINDLVAVNEPAAPRRSVISNKASVTIERSEEEPEVAEEPQEPAAAEAKKRPAAKRGEKTK